MKIKTFCIMLLTLVTVFILTGCSSKTTSTGDAASAGDSKGEEYVTVGTFTTENDKHTSNFVSIWAGSTDESKKVLFDDIKIVGNDNFTYVDDTENEHNTSQYYVSTYYTFPENETYEIQVRSGVDIENMYLQYYNNVNSDNKEEFSSESLVGENGLDWKYVGQKSIIENEE